MAVKGCGQFGLQPRAAGHRIPADEAEIDHQPGRGGAVPAGKGPAAGQRTHGGQSAVVCRHVGRQWVQSQLKRPQASRSWSLPITMPRNPRSASVGTRQKFGRSGLSSRSRRQAPPKLPGRR